MSDSEDSDVKRAIALSLQDSPMAKPVFIDLTSDDEDDDLDAPIHVKKNKLPPPRGRDSVIDDQSQLANTTNRESDGQKDLLPSGIEPQVGPDTTPQIPSPSTGSAMLGLNRAQMEADRLARVQQKKMHDDEVFSGLNDSKKRKASTSKNLSGSQDGRQVKAKYSTAWQNAEEGIASLNPTLSSAHKSADLREIRPPTQDHRSLTLFGPGSPIDASRSSKALAQRSPPEVLSLHQQKAREESGVQYPDGVVKKTWVKGCPRDDDTITIEEVLQKEDLELAVLSTFQIDADWITTKILDKTQVIWVLHARDDKEKQNLQNLAPKNYRFCFPSLRGNINMMHTKLQLLAHPTHLRVVVPSANLVPYDWGESGVMENVCFLIDLPRLAEDMTVDPGQTSEFGKELLRFVRAMGLSSNVVQSLSRFDFLRTTHIGFIHSIGGSHLGTEATLTGYCGLGTAVRNLGLASDEAVNIDIVSPEILRGQFTSPLMASYISFPSRLTHACYVACSLPAIFRRTLEKRKKLTLMTDMPSSSARNDGRTEYGWRTDKPLRGHAGTEIDAERKLSDNLKDCFRIYFPSKETIAKSKGGLSAAGTICFQSKWYDADDFPRHLMRDGRSTRGVLMHNKMMFVQLGNSHKQGREWAGWAYIGSHNFSESAWGRLVKDKTTKQPKLNCRNWECGVIFPVPADAEPARAQAVAPEQRAGDSESQSQSLASMEIFRGYVPVPMVVPAEGYGTKRPWFFQE